RSELDHHLEVLDAGGELADAAALGLRMGERGGDLLGVLDVVPQVLRGGLLLEVGDPGVERLDVRHLLDGGQGGAELGDLCGEVDGSHEARVYGRALGARGAAGAPWRAREGSVPRRGAVPGRRERPEPEVTPHLGQQLLPVLERSAGGTGTGGEI